MKPIIYLYPPVFADALAAAAGRSEWSDAERLAEIDRLTDLLAQRGYCRSRADASLRPGS